jgi:hypothetical protein
MQPLSGRTFVYDLHALCASLLASLSSILFPFPAYLQAEYEGKLADMQAACDKQVAVVKQRCADKVRWYSTVR